MKTCRLIHDNKIQTLVLSTTTCIRSSESKIIVHELCQQKITVKMLHSNSLWSFWWSKVQFIIAVSDITASNLFFAVFYTSFFWTQFTSVQLKEFTNLWPVQEEAQRYANSDDCVTFSSWLVCRLGKWQLMILQQIRLFYKRVTTAFKDQHFRTIHYMVRVFPWSPCGSYWL
jgi:hypothetical protein